MGKEPRNAQVVVQDSSEGHAIFLIDEDGIICTAKPREQMTHVIDSAETENGAPRSVLNDRNEKQGCWQEALVARELELREMRERLCETQQALDDANERYQQLEGELVGVKAALEKEKRLKRYGGRSVTCSFQTKTHWMRKR